MRYHGLPVFFDRTRNWLMVFLVAIWLAVIFSQWEGASPMQAGKEPILQKWGRVGGIYKPGRQKEKYQYLWMFALC